jgi:hypothetical protein
VLALGLVAAGLAGAQNPQRPAAPSRPPATQSNVPSGRPGAVVDLRAPDTPEAVRRLPTVPGQSWTEVRTCTLQGPAGVQGYRVQCHNATFLNFQIADGFIPGDHWQLKGKSWDRAPNEAVTTSPGPANQYGLAARVYNYGGTPENPGTLDAYVECTYLHGVNVFPAGAWALFASDGTCTVTPDTIRSRIDRAP